VTESPSKQEVNALSHAVAMTGAALSDEFRHLGALYYHSARHYIELTEMQKENCSFQSLEILQALLLIVQYEFIAGCKSAARAWMTHGRAMRLAKLLCFDLIDANEPPKRSDSLRLPLKSSSSRAEMDERRRTFWVGFSHDFFISAITNTLPTLQTSEVFLPSDSIFMTRTKTRREIDTHLSSLYQFDR